MAEILPFRGLLYNPDKIKDIAELVTPPYDVISDHEQSMYYARHLHNVIRLDKSKASGEDCPHQQAAADFKSWIENDILIRDKTPCLYLTSVEFEMEGKPVLRYGLIARVRLEPFSRKVILPHEKTYSKVKNERLELMKACHANLSPIFSVFPDKSNIFPTVIKAVSNVPPVFEFTDDAGHRHKLWRIMDTKIQKKVSGDLKETRLFIADGHHRYETALNYREWLSQQQQGLPLDHPSNFIMMYLCSVADHELIILPAHRLLLDIPESVRNEFLHKADAYFDIERFPFNSQNPETMMATLRKHMAPSPDQHRIGVFIKGHPDFMVLALKPGIMDQFFEKTIEGPLRDLDVTVLTRLILIHLLGFTDEILDSEKKISFTSKLKDAVLSVADGPYDMAFILNPTTNEQVMKIAEQGLIMPRKSTYFYPKAVTGMVMNLLAD